MLLIFVDVLDLAASGTLKVNGNSKINVISCVKLGGRLIFNATNSTFLLFSTPCYTGSFSSIKVIINNKVYDSSCNTVALQNQQLFVVIQESCNSPGILFICFF
jgi:hypothetical protein